MRFLALHAPTTTAPAVNVPTSIHWNARSENTKNELEPSSSISVICCSYHVSIILYCTYVTRVVVTYASLKHPRHSHLIPLQIHRHQAEISLPYQIHLRLESLFRRIRNTLKLILSR